MNKLCRFESGSLTEAGAHEVRLLGFASARRNGALGVTGCR